jgi:hypothetical protein
MLMRKLLYTVAAFVTTAAEPAAAYIRSINPAVQGHNIEHFDHVSVIDCEDLCDNRDWCKSFDYYKATKECDLADVNSRDVDGLKGDYAGNPFDNYQKPDNSGLFIKISNAAISGWNREHHANVDVVDCENLCSHRPWCKSFDFYRSSNECDLSDANTDDVGGLKTDYPGNPHDHYRNPKL